MEDECAGLCRQRAAPLEVLLSRGRRACTTAPRVKNTGERTWCTTQRHESRCSRERHVHVGPVEHHEHELRVLVRQCTKSSRVPDPTVDRHLSVNSGAERMGATTMCLAMCVMTERGNPRKQQNMSCECVLKIACLGEGSSSKPKATEAQGVPQEGGDLQPNDQRLHSLRRRGVRHQGASALYSTM